MMVMIVMTAPVYQMAVTLKITAVHVMLTAPMIVCRIVLVFGVAVQKFQIFM